MAQDLMKLLRTVWFTPGVMGRWGLPVIFKGPPGGAKTSKLLQAAEMFGLGTPGRGFEAIVGSVREPADFIGLPRIIDGATHYAVPAWAHRLIHCGGGVAFLDELNTSAPATQAAMLRAVLEGAVGDALMPERVRWVAAMNATEDAAGGWDLAAPLANRFGHMDWPAIDARAWGDWLVGSDVKAEAIDAAAEEKRVMEAWPAAWAKARGRVAGFLRARGELLHKQPKSGSPEASGAWPSPRTWEMAARATAGAAIQGLSDEDTDELVAAFIGSAAQAEFMSWSAQADLPDPVDVLDGKVKFVPNSDRLDVTAAVLQGCTAYVITDKSKQAQARVDALWTILGSISETHGDLAIPPMTAMINAKLHAKNKVAFAMMANYDKLTQAAIR